MPPRWPLRTSQYGVSFLLHIVRCTNRMWTFLWFYCPSSTDPSWRHFDNHNRRLLRLGASRLWNWGQKPRCITATHRFCKQLHYHNAVFHWPALHISYDMGSRLKSKYHCPWWWSVCKQRITDKLVFKFKNRRVFLAHPLLIKLTLWHLTTLNDIMQTLLIWIELQRGYLMSLLNVLEQRVELFDDSTVIPQFDWEMQVSCFVGHRKIEQFCLLNALQVNCYFNWLKYIELLK